MRISRFIAVPALFVLWLGLLLFHGTASAQECVTIENELFSLDAFTRAQKAEAEVYQVTSANFPDHVVIYAIFAQTPSAAVLVIFEKNKETGAICRVANPLSGQPRTQIMINDQVKALLATGERIWSNNGGARIYKMSSRDA